MQSKSILRNNKGVAAIEMAIVLPILLMIIMAVIEFGLYFMKSQAASRAVSTASIAIQQKPDDGTIQLTMKNNGLGMMDLGALPNFVCAKSYADANTANTGSCVAGEWNTAAPNGLAAGATYYVAVRAFAVHTPLTPLRSISGAFPPDIDERVVVTVGSSSTTNRITALKVGSGSSWTVPAGVTSFKATIVGAGASSGNGVAIGGSAGGVIIAYFSNLTPNTNLSFSVGQGGSWAYGSGSGTAAPGGNTSFNGITAGGGRVITSGIGGDWGI